MIYIVTGEKNSGKTSKIKEIYAKKGGDGFISEKIIKDDIFYGYKLIRLSTGESKEFIYKNKYVPDNLKGIDIIKNIRFTFYKSSFYTAENWIDEILSKDVSNIYIDEIGKLELNQGGFYNITKNIINKKKDIYITTRDIYLKKIVDKFNIQNYNVINVF